MKLARLAVFLSFMLAVPALAQDGSETATNRTPAGAQQFIAKMRPPLFFISMQYYVPTAFSSPDACKTEIGGVPAAFSGATAYPESGGTPQNFLIDWSSVEDVVADEDDHTHGQGVKYYILSLKTPQGTYPAGLHLWFNVALTRDRVMAAARYLRDACDKTKDSGF